MRMLKCTERASLISLSDPGDTDGATFRLGIGLAIASEFAINVPLVASLSFGSNSSNTRRGEKNSSGSDELE